MGYAKPNAIMNAAQQFIMVFVQRPRFTLFHVPGLEFPNKRTSRRFTPKTLQDFSFSSARTLSSSGQPPAGSSGLLRARFVFLDGFLVL